MWIVVKHACHVIYFFVRFGSCSNEERALTVCLCFFLLCVYTCETGMSRFYCQFHVPDEILTKLKEIFFQQITHIFIFFSSLQLDGVEIFHHLNCLFFPFRQTQAPYLVITLRLQAILSKEYSVKKKRNICIQGLPETASYLLPHVSR